MKYNLLILLTILSFSASTQSYQINKDFPGIGWPFLWDIEQDDSGRLYTCSELGYLFIKENGEWSEFDLDDGNADARSIEVSDNGVVWITTDNGLFQKTGNNFLKFDMSNTSMSTNSFGSVTSVSNIVYVTASGNGLYKIDGDDYENINMSNSELESNSVKGLKSDDNGDLYFNDGTNLYHVESNGNWNVFDVKSMMGTTGLIQGTTMDEDNKFWISTRLGIIVYNPSNKSFENLQTKYGERNYLISLHTPNGDVWANELFEGMHFFGVEGVEYFFSKEDNFGNAPDQVFDMEWYNDTLRVVGNIGSAVGAVTVGFTSSISDLPVSKVQIYPNPASNALHFGLKPGYEGQFEFSIYNNLGNKIITTKSNIVDVSSFSNGQYYVQIKDLESGIIRKELVVITN